MLEKLLKLQQLGQSEIFRLAGSLFVICVILILLTEVLHLRKRNPYKIQKFEISEKYLIQYYTQNEWLNEHYWGQYKKLRYLMHDKEVVIVPMVDILALVQPKIYLKNREELIRKLAGQHIDFMICTMSMKPIALIRLLDHSRQNGQDELDDKYAVAVLKASGYDVRTTWDITEDTLKNIR